MSELQNKQPSVSIIILNYNTYEDTIECIRELEKIEYSNYEIIVVDNNSINDSESILRSTFPDYKIIKTHKNLGYAGGNNVGIKLALESNSQYICILNNDVLVKRDYLNKLVTFMEDNKEIGITGPKVLEYNDMNQVQATGGSVNFYLGKTYPINKGRNSDEIKSEAIYCDFIGGACILIKREVVEKIGMIPEEYFLFYEETEWCLKAKETGYKICCFTGAEVVHKGSVTINKYSKISKYFGYRNRMLFEKRNANKVQFGIFYLLLFVNLIIKIALGKEDKEALEYYMDGRKESISSEISNILMK